MRTKRKVLLILGLLALIAILAGGAAWYLLRGRETGGSPRQVRSPASLEERMASLTTPGILTLDIPGTVSYADTAYPIRMLSRHISGEPGANVLLTGGIHGNEPAGTEFLLQFAETLSKDPSAWPEIHFDIIPVVNPWGWVHAARRNGEGRDLNREFGTFKAPESVLMQKVFKRKHYDLIVDFHEDGHVGGFYFYRLANPDETLCRSMIEAVRSTGNPVHDGRVMKIFRAKEGIITSPLWSLKLARTIRQLSMSNYFRLEGCPHAFLFESPKRLPLETRVAMHGAALTRLLDSLQKDRKSQ